MVGGIGTGMKPASQGAGGAMQQQGAGMAAPPMGEQPQGEAATPEEQKLFNNFIAQAMDIIYPEDQKGQPSLLILGNLQGDLDPKVLEMFDQAEPPLSGSPQDSVAATGVLLTILVDQKLGYGAKAREGGGGLDYDAVMLHAGTSIIEELIELAEAAKIHDFSEQDIEGITYRAMDLYGTAARKIGLAGYDQAALKEEFISIIEANNTGKLDKVLPGLPGGAPMMQGAA